MTAYFQLLTSLREICTHFHVRRETALLWRSQGAPIVRVSEKNYLAEPDQLWEWLVTRQREEMRPSASQCVPDSQKS